MSEQVRLLEGPFSRGLEAVTRLTRSSGFTVELGDAIIAGGEDRAVHAMRREFFPSQPQTGLVGNGNHPYRDASGQPLPPDHYLVTFNYGKLPSMKELKIEFKGGVSGIFDGRAWRKHASAIPAGERPGQKVIWIPETPKDLLDDSEKIIAWGDQYRTEISPNGYRPIMGQHELLDLHRAHPELFKQFWMGALGSFTLGDNRNRRVGVLCAVDGGPLLGGGWFDGEWRGGSRFPFVSK